MIRRECGMSFLLLLSLLSIAGCEGPDSSTDLAGDAVTWGKSVERLTFAFADDEKEWSASAGNRRFVFIDANGDGLAESIRLYESGVFRRTLWFHSREFLRDTDLFPDGLQPGSLTGASIIIPPKPPLARFPVKTERLTDSTVLGAISDALSRHSYKWRSQRIAMPAATGNQVDTVEIGTAVSLDYEPWIGLDLWIDKRTKPVTLWVFHANNSYCYHTNSMMLVTEAGSSTFSNDVLTEVLVSCFAPRMGGDDEGVLYFPLGPSPLRRGAYVPPTFFGGISVGAEGAPSSKPTKEEMTSEAKALLMYYYRDIIPRTTK